MRVAVYALTRRGIEIALRLRYLQHDVDLFAPKKRFVRGYECTWTEQKFPETLTSNFSKYDGHICVMALGIVVRALAPLVQSKLTDPAVVVVDDCGQYAISTLSGHLGGANTLTQEVSDLLQAVCVITTASDQRKQLTPDLWARLAGWTLAHPEGLTSVNSAIVHDEPVSLVVDTALLEQPYPWGMPCRVQVDGYRYEFSAIEPLQTWHGQEPAVLLTPRQVAAKQAENAVILRPKSLVVGIGCKRNTATSVIMEAIQSVFSASQLCAESIASLASIDLKCDEVGMLQTAAHLGVGICFVPAADIAASGLEYEQSQFVRNTTGVGGVCEPTAMIVAQNNKLLVSRQKQNGVTVAVATRTDCLDGYTWSASAPEREST